MWKSLKVAAALSGLLFMVTACGQKPSSPPVPKGASHASQEWNKVTAAFAQSYFDSRPFFAAQSGRHEYDDTEYRHL